jgi:hypothetical protein
LDKRTGALKLVGMNAGGELTRDGGLRWAHVLASQPDHAAFGRTLSELLARCESSVQAAEYVSSACAALEWHRGALLEYRRQTAVGHDAIALRLRQEASRIGMENAQDLLGEVAGAATLLASLDECIGRQTAFVEIARTLRQGLAEIASRPPNASPELWPSFCRLFGEMMTEGTAACSGAKAAVEAARIAKPTEAVAVLDRHLEATVKAYVTVNAVALAPTWVDVPLVTAPRPRSRSPRARRVAATGPPPAEPAPEPPSRPEFGPYLTSREAAIYLGFKSTSAIRKAVFDGRLHPIGRRGGRGTHLFTIAELDRFARGDPPATVGSDRPGAPKGDAHGQRNEVDQALEVLGGANAPPGRVEAAGRRASGPSARGGPHYGPDAGDKEGHAERGRTDRLHLVERRTRTHPVGRQLGAASEDALRRIRSVTVRKKGHREGHQKRSKP